MNGDGRGIAGSGHGDFHRNVVAARDAGRDVDVDLVESREARGEGDQRECTQPDPHHPA